MRGISVSTALVKQLRDLTGAGIMDCKRALDESDGDVQKAAEILRQQGMAKAEKKMGRTARMGLVDAYIHPGGRIGSMVELNCETDFVARTPEFQSLAHDLAMQVAAMDPKYVTTAEVPDEAREQGIAEYGDERRFLEAVVLMHQPFIKDSRRTMEDLVRDAMAKMGENIVVRRATRFELGATVADSVLEDE
jgi:elongation factor Ts